MATDFPAHMVDTSLVEAGAIVGPSSRIWHNSHVRAGATLGEAVVVGDGAFIDSGVVVGSRSKIQNNAQLFGPATLGEGVFIGPGVILTNDLHPRAVHADGSPIRRADWVASGCTIGRGASIGAASTVVCTEVGEWALVGAGSIVVRPVAPHGLAVGNPAHQIGWVCYCGQRQVTICERCGWKVP